MTKDTKYRCNFCQECMGVGYGINWTGKGGGDTINFVTDNYNAKQLEHHLCRRCVEQIAALFTHVEMSGIPAVIFGEFK